MYRNPLRIVSRPQLLCRETRKDTSILGLQGRRGGRINNGRETISSDQFSPPKGAPLSQTSAMKQVRIPTEDKNHVGADRSYHGYKLFEDERRKWGGGDVRGKSGRETVLFLRRNQVRRYIKRST